MKRVTNNQYFAILFVDETVVFSCVLKYERVSVLDQFSFEYKDEMEPRKSFTMVLADPGGSWFNERYLCTVHDTIQFCQYRKENKRSTMVDFWRLVSLIKKCFILNTKSLSLDLFIELLNRWKFILFL